jgi:hypothetical protein
VLESEKNLAVRKLADCEFVPMVPNGRLSLQLSEALHPICIAERSKNCRSD